MRQTESKGKKAVKQEEGEKLTGVDSTERFDQSCSFCGRHHITSRHHVLKKNVTFMHFFGLD